MVDWPARCWSIPQTGVKLRVAYSDQVSYENVVQTTEFWSPIVGGMESGEPQRAGIWNQQFFEPGTYYFRSLVPPCRPPPKRPGRAVLRQAS